MAKQRHMAQVAAPLYLYRVSFHRTRFYLWLSHERIDPADPPSATPVGAAARWSDRFHFCLFFFFSIHFLLGTMKTRRIFSFDSGRILAAATL
jgi:hypothetical protein